MTQLLRENIKEWEHYKLGLGLCKPSENVEYLHLCLMITFRIFYFIFRRQKQISLRVKENIRRRNIWKTEVKHQNIKTEIIKLL